MRMQSGENYLDKTSVHYFFPAPQQHRDLLYYPVSAGFFECLPGYTVQRNTFSSYLLIVMMSGTLSFQTRKTRGVARQGQVLLLDCNAPHFYAAQNRCSFTFVHFDGAQSRELYEEIEHMSGNLLIVQDVNLLHESIGELIRTMRHDRLVSETQMSAMLYTLLMQLMQASGATPDAMTGNEMVDRAIAYIQAHFSEKLTVEQVADRCGYSSSYFSHIFTQETGLSPYRFIMKSRMDSAMHLLLTTTLTVQEIAFQTGFNSSANFCYTFRKEVGVSPHEFRKIPVPR